MPITAALISSIAAPMVGAGIGKLMSGGDEAQQRALQEQALRRIQDLPPLDAEKLKVAFEKYKLTGEISPEMQNIISQSDSEMGKISTDPALKQAQMSALNKLQSMGAGGLNAEDMAALSQVQNAAAGAGQAQQASALQAMQQRGLGGSGSELAARLSAAQGAANTVSQGGLNIQGQASQRALQAIMDSGSLGGKMRDQDFNEASQKAQAQDIINRFNAANAQNVTGQNVDARNKAKYYNTGEAQRIADMNARGTTDERLQHAGADQAAWNAQYQKAVAAAGGDSKAAEQAGQRAASTQQLYGGLGQAVGTGAAGLASNYQQNKATDAYSERTKAMSAGKQANPIASNSINWAGVDDEKDPNKLPA